MTSSRKWIPRLPLGEYHQLIVQELCFTSRTFVHNHLSSLPCLQQMWVTWPGGFNNDLSPVSFFTLGAACEGAPQSLLFTRRFFYDDKRLKMSDNVKNLRYVPCLSRRSHLLMLPESYWLSHTRLKRLDGENLEDTDQLKDEALCENGIQKQMLPQVSCSECYSLKVYIISRAMRLKLMTMQSPLWSDGRRLCMVILARLRFICRDLKESRSVADFRCLICQRFHFISGRSDDTGSNPADPVSTHGKRGGSSYRDE